MESIKDMVNMSYGVTLTVMAVAWAVIGLAGFFYSLFCVTKTPSILKGIFGVALSILIGPLYFVYWYVDQDYCRGDAAGLSATK